MKRTTRKLIAIVESPFGMTWETEIGTHENWEEPFTREETISLVNKYRKERLGKGYIICDTYSELQDEVF